MNNELFASSRPTRALAAVAAFGWAAFPGAVVADDPAANLGAARELSNSFRHAIEVARPSIVSIRTVGRWSGPDAPAEGFRSGNATGIVVEKTGGVLTSFHAVADADAVFVALSDGRQFPVTEIRVDPWSDLALVRFAGAGELPVARWAAPEEVEVGDWVLAAGNSFGLGFSANPGTVSGKDREVAESNLLLLQTNAPSNPGNSGGPLLNLRGEVVGVSEGAYSVEGGFDGVAFAVPVEAAKFVVQELADHGRVRWPYLGLSFETLSPEVATGFACPPGVTGAIVTDVVAAGPAASAGMRVGDIVTRCGDDDVRDAAKLLTAIQKAEVERPISIELLRAGVKVGLDATPGLIPKNERPHPHTTDGETPEPGDEEYTDRELGITVADLPPNRKEFAPGITGVLVTDVRPRSAAYYLGVHPGTVVTHVAAEPVPNAASFKKIAAERPQGTGAILLVWCADCGAHFFPLHPSLARAPVRLPIRD